MIEQPEDGILGSEKEIWIQLPGLKGEERAQALDTLGFCAFERKEFASASILAEESAVEYETLDRIPDAINAMVNSSFSWCLNHDAVESTRTGLEALRIIRLNGVEKILPNVLRKLGRCLSFQEQKQDAIEVYNLAATAFLAKGEMHDAGHAMSETASLLEESGEIYESLSMYEAALETIKGESLKSCCLDPMLKLTDLYMEFEDYVSAEEIIKNAQSLKYMQGGSVESFIELDILTITLANEMGQFRKAHNLARKTLEKIAKSGDSKFVAECSIELARSNFGLHEMERGLRTLYKAVRIADMNGQVDNLKKALYVGERGIMEESKLKTFIEFVSSRKSIKDEPELGEFVSVRLIDRLISTNQREEAATLLDSALKRGISETRLLDFYVLRAKIACRLNNFEVLSILVSKLEEIASNQNLETEQKIANLIRTNLEQYPAKVGLLLDMFNYRTDEKSRSSQLTVELTMFSSSLSNQVP